MKAMYVNKRRKNTEKPKTRIYYVSFVIMLSFAAGAIVLLAGHFIRDIRLLPVREIVFHGNNHLSDGDMMQISGIKAGEDLLMLFPRTVSEKLMISPWIKSASIRKDFPDRVLINISEATPFAILDNDGQTFLIDEKGRMLEEMKNDPVPFLPVIYSGAHRNHDNFREALNLAKIIKDKKIATERSRVEILANVKTPEDITLIIDKVVVKIGNGDYEQKLDRLFTIEEEIKKRALAVDYVDLRFANRVVVKPINEVIR